MSSEIITAVIASLGGGVAFWGAVKSGLVKIQIGAGNSNGKNDHRLEDLEEHAKIANQEMGEVKERLIGIETKLDILMRHLKI